MNTPDTPDFAAENAELRARLEEAEETLRAIRTGEVDALVIGEEVYTLKGAETPYRLLIESMNEGAATLAPDGTILYCNRRFADMVATPAEQIIGSSLERWVVPAHQPIVRSLMTTAEHAGTRAELAFSVPPGPDLPVMLSLRPIQLDSHTIGVVAADLTERKAHEERLRQLNQELEDTVRQRTAELQAIFDTAPIGLAIADDPEGRHIRGNPANERMLGIGRGEELSLGAPQSARYRPLQDGRELPVEQLPMQRAIRGETVTGQIIDILRPDGQTITLYSNAAPLLDEQGRPCGAVGTFVDITKLKQAEEAVSRSQKTFSELVERAPFGIYVVDSQFRIAQMNTGSQNGAFRNVRPVIGRPFTEAMPILWPEPVATEIIGHFRHTLDTGEPYYSPPFINPRHDVEFVEAYEWELHRMMLPDGQFGVICYYFDSTKLREAEAALRESEGRLRLAQRHGGVGVWGWNVQTGELHFEPETEQLYGLLPGTVRTYADWTSRVYPDDLSRIEAERDAALAQRGTFQVEFRIRHGSGEERWITANGRADNDRAGRMSWVLGVNIDITARKQAEQALFAAKQRLQTLMQAVPVGVSFSDDPTCQRVTGNPAVLAQFEVGAADNLSASAPDAVAPGRQVRFFRDGQPITDADLPLQRAVAENREIGPMELEVLLPSGRRWFAQASGAPILDHQGNVVGGVAVTVDITALKQAEAALRQSREEYRHLVEGSGSVILRADKDMRITFMNQYGLRFFGYVAEELIGQRALGTIIPSADAAGRDIAAMAEDLMQHPDQYSTNVHQNHCKDGRLVWMSWANKAIYGDHGQLIEILAIGNDLTKLKQAEEALRQSEERYRLLYDRNPDGVFVLDSTGRFLVANPACEAISGYPIAELLQKSFMDVCAPDQLDRTKEYFERGVRECKSLQLETALLQKDGRRVEVWIAGGPIAGEGKTMTVHCTARDITERKRMEEEVRRRAEELRATNEELDRFNQAMVGRELRMIELKQEINALCTQLQQSPRYPSQADYEPKPPSV